MDQSSTFSGCEDRGQNWYDLFSRGSRDWLRHNEKVREAVLKKLPDVIADSYLMGGDGDRKVRVPVRFLEHFRFRLSTPDKQKGTGHGDAKPGDQLAQPGQQKGKQGGQGGNDEGGIEFVLELKIDDLIDWLWEELELPNMEVKSGTTRDDEYTREGWNRRGARSRLDRRRSIKEAIKRRAVDKDGPAFTNDDLRFRQLVMRQQPATQAVVFLAMDVSSSMRERDRKLAKTFFFWAIQGLRRQYTYIDLVFIAHTVKAWEFEEEEFFQVRGSGGTVASTAFRAVNQIIDERYDPSRYNIYLFYASDGENFRDDCDPAETALARIAQLASYIGYVETPATEERALDTETAAIFNTIAEQGAPVDSYALTSNESIWAAIRAFFRQQTGEQAA